jgi:hypothetical protein
MAKSPKGRGSAYMVGVGRLAPRRYCGPLFDPPQLQWEGYPVQWRDPPGAYYWLIDGVWRRNANGSAPGDLSWRREPWLKGREPRKPRKPHWVVIMRRNAERSPHEHMLAAWMWARRITCADYGKYNPEE